MDSGKKINSALKEIGILTVISFIYLVSLYNIQDSHAFYIASCFIAHGSIIVLFYRFHIAYKNEWLLLPGLVYITLVYVLLSILAFSGVYAYKELYLNNLRVINLNEIIAYSISNFINKSSNLTCNKDVSISNAMQSFYGIAIVAFFIGRFSDALKERK